MFKRICRPEIVWTPEPPNYRLVLCPKSSRNSNCVDIAEEDASVVKTRTDANDSDLLIQFQ
jgi:hypothetical protein